jgi:hypothetical protein
MGRALHGAAEAMTAADVDHQTELADDDGHRKARDDQASELVAAVTQLREALDGVYGSEAIQTYGIKGTTPRDPAGIAAFARQMADRLSADALPKPKISASIDRNAAAADLMTRVGPLEAALSNVAREAREAEGTLVVRDAAMDRFDQTFGRTSAALVGLYRLGGQDELGSRIRPSRRRPGRLAEPGEAAADEPAETTDEVEDG